MHVRGRRVLVGALSLICVMAVPALAQSTRDEWLALRTRKQARHHRNPSLATQPNAFTITTIRFFSDASGNLVGVGEARNDTSLDLSYSRINFRFLDVDGGELGREWTYLHGGVNAQLVTTNAYETLLIPGATGFFKVWTTIPAALMMSYTAESAGENLPYAKPRASLGLDGTRPERWTPLVYVSSPYSPNRVVGQRFSSIVFNDDPLDPNCPCGHTHVFTSSVQVSVAAYVDGVLADVQSATAVGPQRTATCTEPQATGMTLHEYSSITIDFSRPVDSIRMHSVEWDENEQPATMEVSYSRFFSFEHAGGEGSFTIDPWCGATPVVSPPWISVVEAGPSGPTEGRVRFTVASNPDTSTRYGSLSVRGAQVQVTQYGACPVFRSETIFLSGGRVTDMRTVDVPRPSCLPDSQISLNVDWLQVATAGGALKLRLWAEPNFTGATRTGVVTLGERTLTVHQLPAARSFDLNNDGQLDLLWHHRTEGWVGAWRMDGSQMGDGTLLSWNRVPDTNWTPAFVADLDRNSAPDVVWQNHVTRGIADWRLAGITVLKGESLLFSASSTEWKLRSSADVNRDGDPDFVWQHETTGEIEVWYMLSGIPPQPAFPAFSGGPPMRLGTAPLGPGVVSDLNWKIVGSGDFNRDGWPDLVWQHQTDGRIAVWKMNGATLLDGAPISPGQLPDLNWKIRAVGDMNGDDMPDLIWQHRVDGRVAVWLMNGTTMTSAVVIAQLADTNWEIVGPR